LDLIDALSDFIDLHIDDGGSEDQAITGEAGCN